MIAKTYRWQKTAMAAALVVLGLSGTQAFALSLGRLSVQSALGEPLRAELDAILRDYDALVLPTTGVPAPLRGQTEVQVASGLMSTRDAGLGMTAPYSYVGLPTISLPWGRVEGLPGSLQVVGARDQDAALLALAAWLESRG